MIDGKWPVEKAVAWYQTQPWLRGCNFIPSTAINQLEMWQAETFDLETIDRELGWAVELGLNAMRVYLHDLVWCQDPVGFKKRIEQYLRVSDRHGIKTVLCCSMTAGTTTNSEELNFDAESEARIF